MRVVTVTPAGRRRYTPLLAQSLLQQRDVIDQHHWWACTRDQNDRAKLFELTAKNPDFFRVNDQPYYGDRTLMSNIWKFNQDCIDPETIYIRLDDDICYIAPDAIRNLVNFRLENPEPFLVLGNIVNNAVCAHFHQRAGLIPTFLGTTTNECEDPASLGSAAFARIIHRTFLRDLDRGATERWQQTSIEHKGFQRFSVNAICWFGRDMQSIPEIYHQDIKEEQFLTIDLPRRMGRPNVVCSGALFSHFAFGPQRDQLEWTARDLLGQYARFAGENPGAPRSEWSWRLSDSVYRLRSFVWRASTPIRWLRRKWHERAVVRRTLRSEGKAAAEETRLTFSKRKREAEVPQPRETKSA